ncbi:CynX/NimT family MFS transporter [Dactylosporangium sp. CA-233914]|uniref:CynX/NimT family MFS transporter n=1 Tax=Dactylosporangium sp. CA-233914 TaxID=3239934 RepID=UPI003D8C75A1
MSVSRTDTDAPPGTTRGARVRRSPAISWGLIAAIVIAASNLRPALTSVGALLPEISDSSALTHAWAGVLGTLPLLTFAAVSPAVGRLSRRLGDARLMVLAMSALAFGTLIRSSGALWGLFVGTLVLSAGIAVGNVLLPAIIRHRVAVEAIPHVSAIYVTILGLFAAVSPAIAVPLAHWLPGGWRPALAWALIVCLVAIAVWLPMLRAERDERLSRARAEPLSDGLDVSAAPRIELWRSSLAWQVSLFMGMQSLAFYSIVAWLPTILRADGVTSTTAGWALFVYQIVSTASSMVVPVLTPRPIRSQGAIAVAAALLVSSGFLMLVVLPDWYQCACVLMGAGGGACLVLALAFQSQRARNRVEAVALAGMAQSVGYLIAATGPFTLGVLQGFTGTWAVPLLMLSSLSLIMAGIAACASRDKHIPLRG